MNLLGTRRRRGRGAGAGDCRGARRRDGEPVLHRLCPRAIPDRAQARRGGSRQRLEGSLHAPGRDLFGGARRRPGFQQGGRCLRQGRRPWRCQCPVLARADGGGGHRREEEGRAYRRKSVREGGAKRQSGGAIQPRRHLSRRRGRPTDEAKAAEWMQKAAEAGNAQAEYDLGGFYQFGRGVPIDKAKAAEWTGRAAEAGLVGCSSRIWGDAVQGRGRRRRRGQRPPRCSAWPPSKATPSPRTGSRASTPTAWR